MKTKFAECAECYERLNIGDVAIVFEGDVFCSTDCVTDSLVWKMEEIKISEKECTEEEGDAE